MIYFLKKNIMINSILNNDCFNFSENEEEEKNYVFKKDRNISNSIAHSFLQKTEEIEKANQTTDQEIDELISKAQETKEELETIYNIINEHIWNLKNRLKSEINKSWNNIISLNENIRKISLNKDSINQMIVEIDENIKTINNDPDIRNEELEKMEEERKICLNRAKDYLIKTKE
jgi:chromosome segregation ATPase